MLRMNQKLNIINGGNELTNRKAVENKSIDILLHPEENTKKDFMHSRNSGLNQVLCRLANKNNVSIGFSFNNILNSSGMKRAILLGRMIQNVILCKKYKVKMIVVNHTANDCERDNGDLKSFGICLGMHPSDVHILKIR